MNKLVIIGNLTADPESRTTQNGKTVCNFTVAVNRRKGANGKQEADFFRISVWNEKGETCQKYLTKGRKVCVIGAVSVSQYTGNDGQQRAGLNVMADEVEFLSSGNQNAAQADTAPAAVQPNLTPVSGDDSLPF